MHKAIIPAMILNIIIPSLLYNLLVMITVLIVLMNDTSVGIRYKISRA